MFHSINYNFILQVLKYTSDEAKMTAIIRNLVHFKTIYLKK